jgi:protein-tyrosine phosphatase
MSPTPSTLSVLFVCMGNICRSPTAHGVFRHKLRHHGLSQQVRVESAATHDYHPGSPPDPRSQEHAGVRGYDISDWRARQIRIADLDQHDLVLVMDWDNLAHLRALAEPRHLPKIRRLTEFCVQHNATVVPDPFHGTPDSFEHTLDLIEDACDGLVGHLRGLLQTRNTP